MFLDLVNIDYFNLESLPIVFLEELIEALMNIKLHNMSMIFGNNIFLGQIIVYG